MASNNSTTPSTPPVVDPSTDPTPGEIREWGEAEETYSTDGYDSDDSYCSNPSDSEEEDKESTSTADDDHDGYEVSEEDAINWLRTTAPSGLQRLVTSGRSGNRKGWRIGKGNNPTNFYISLREALSCLRRPVNLTICRQDGVVVDKRYIVQYLKENHPIKREVKTITCRNCGDKVTDIVAHLKATNCAYKATSTNAKVQKVCKKVTGAPGKSNRRPQQGAKTGNPSQKRQNAPERQPVSTTCKYCGCVTRNIRQHLLDNNCRFKAEQAVHEEEERQRTISCRSKTSPKRSSTSRSSKGKVLVTFTTSANRFEGLKKKTTTY